MRKRKASSDLSRTKNKKPEVADSVTIIDGDGDLQIDLTDDWGNLQGLLVNRHVLRLASPVFAAMFAKDSPFEESRNRVTNDNSVQVVKFEDDDFGAMCIIMNVIHFQGHRVPRELPLNGLDIIASLCDKYDLSSHLGPWGHLWAKQFLQEGAHGHCNRLLRISVAMKLPEEYTFITRHLIQYATLSDKGTLKIGDESIDGDSDFTEAVPDYILESVIEARNEAVTELLALCWAAVFALRRATDDTRGVCCHVKTSLSEATDCDALNLGCLIHQFPELVGPHPALSKPDSCNVKSILDRIQDMKHLDDMEILTTQFVEQHTRKCDVGRSLSADADKWWNKVKGLQLETVPQGDEPEPPEELRQELDAIRSKYKDDLFDVEMRRTVFSTLKEPSICFLYASPFARINVRDRDMDFSDMRFKFLPSIKCLDCPLRLRALRKIRDLESHLKSDLHKERRRRRIEERKHSFTPDDDEDRRRD